MAPWNGGTRPKSEYEDSKGEALVRAVGGFHDESDTVITMTSVTSDDMLTTRALSLAASKEERQMTAALSTGCERCECWSLSYRATLGTTLAAGEPGGDGGREAPGCARRRPVRASLSKAERIVGQFVVDGGVGGGEE